MNKSELFSPSSIFCAAISSLKCIPIQRANIVNGFYCWHEGVVIGWLLWDFQALGYKASFDLGGCWKGKKN